MPGRLSKKSRMRISPGTFKAVAFLALIVTAFMFWMYIQNIFDHIRRFQKSVVSTHVRIYAKIIDPTSSANSDLIDLFEPVVMQAPYPSIFTDSDLNPIQELWHNVGIAPNDTTAESRRILKKLVRKMDTVNPPERIYIPGLEARPDTLMVYELPDTLATPVLVTDQLSNLLYVRNIEFDPSDTEMLNEIIKTLDFRSPPLRFEKENEPTLVFHHMNSRSSWPIIVVKKGNQPLYWRDIVISARDTTALGEPRLSDNIRFLRENGHVYPLFTNNIPIQQVRLFHYGDLPFLNLIGWLPVFELALALILLSIGFMGILNIKNAEQRSIWVGMAKETAHQLGTPISSLSGWFELLKSEQSKEMVNRALPDMEYDIRRLSRVAARFSSIGSRPELKPIDVSNVIDEVIVYYRARLPRMGKQVGIEREYIGLGLVNGNTELLNWAFENLIKNSLSAIDSDNGRINVTGAMSKDFRHIVFDFKDNGRGIPLKSQKKVMKPGFTTRKRGWGLGLSLVKRIIEDYHNGKVFLMESRVGEGTTFRVILPALKKHRQD